MQLHEIKGKGKSRKRVARGGKRGTTAGRGTKGQKSRSGRRIRPAERDLINKLPKRRGFRNKPKSDKAVVLNLGDIKGRIKVLIGEKSSILTKDLLMEAKVIEPRFRGEVKLLGKGEIDFPLTVKGIEVSESAKAKIEKAGGKIQ